MRILVLNSEFPPIGGGAGNASAHIARELAAQGHEVSVLTAGYRGLPRREYRDGLAIIRLPGRRRSPHRSTALEQLIFMVVAVIWGHAWVRMLKPQAVLAFFGAPSGVAAWAWDFFARLPYIVCLRGGDVPGFRPYDFGALHRLLGPILRRVWRGASAVVANSRGLRQLAQTFEPRAEVQVIPNGVDLDAFQAPARDWEPPRMLFVGRLVHQKGLDILLDALAGLTDIPWQLDLVGDGPRRGRLEAQAVRNGIFERVNFLGWRGRGELPGLYGGANLFVYPSRHEGMPNALLEAMASGLPAVATNISGNEELVQVGETGFLVPPENKEALRASLRQLLGDAALRKSMGAAARMRVEKSYSWAQVANAYLELLEAGLKQR